MTLKTLLDLLFKDYSVVFVLFCLCFYLIYKLYNDIKEFYVTKEAYKKDREADKEKRQDLASSFKDELVRMERLQYDHYNDLKDDIKGIRDLYQSTVKDIEQKILDLYKSRSGK